MKRLASIALTLALAVAAAKTYSVTFFQTSILAGSELRAGHYRLDLRDNMISVKAGRTAVECPVKIERVEEKYYNTRVMYADRGGKTHVREIRLGGTNMKQVVE